MRAVVKLQKNIGTYAYSSQHYLGPEVSLSSTDPREIIWKPMSRRMLKSNFGICNSMVYLIVILRVKDEIFLK
jgi:hypothetical protein